MSRTLTKNRRPISRLATTTTACAALIAATGMALLAMPGTAGASHAEVPGWEGKGSDGAGHGRDFSFCPFGSCNLLSGMTVGPDGAIRVSDGDGGGGVTDRIAVLDPSGAYATEWTAGGDKALKYPAGLAGDSFGNVYVADGLNYRILKLDPSGNAITSWSTIGGTEDCATLKIPHGIATRDGADVFVSYGYGNCIERWTIQATTEGETYTRAGDWGSSGYGDGEFDFPLGLAVDARGDIYVADSQNDRIQKFDAGGVHIATWGARDEAGKPVSGNAPREFNRPLAVAVDAESNVYVADTHNDRIQILTSGGEYVEELPIASDLPAGEAHPVGVAVDASDNVYVAVDDKRLDEQGEEVESDDRIEKWAPPAEPENPCDPAVEDCDGSTGGDDGDGDVSGGDAGGTEPATSGSEAQASTAPTDQGTAGAEPAVRMSTLGLDSARTTKVSRKTLAHYLEKGLRGTVEPASAVKAVQASLVRKRGSRCYKIDKPSKSTSCTATSSRGLKTTSDDATLNFVYKPLATSSSLRHSASAKRVLRRMRRGEVLRRGDYVLTIAVETAGGAARSAAFKLNVR